MECVRAVLGCDVLVTCRSEGRRGSPPNTDLSLLDSLEVSRQAPTRGFRSVHKSPMGIVTGSPAGGCAVAASSQFVVRAPAETLGRVRQWLTLQRPSRQQSHQQLVPRSQILLAWPTGE